MNLRFAFFLPFHFCIFCFPLPLHKILTVTKGHTRKANTDNEKPENRLLKLVFQEMFWSDHWKDCCKAFQKQQS